MKKKKNEELRKNRERKRKSQAEKNEEEKFEEMERNREKMRKYRANKSEEEKNEELRKDRERKERESEQKDALLTEFEKINLKHQKREWRTKRNGKEKLIENLNSKRGMRLFHDEGRLKQFKNRGKKNSDQTMDWKEFMKKVSIMLS